VYRCSEASKGGDGNLRGGVTFYNVNCRLGFVEREDMTEDRTQEFRQRAQQEQEEIKETREDLKREQKQTPDAEDAPREEETRDNEDEE
jgi:hypothetical protein